MRISEMKGKSGYYHCTGYGEPIFHLENGKIKQGSIAVRRSGKSINYQKDLIDDLRNWVFTDNITFREATQAEVNQYKLCQEFGEYVGTGYYYIQYKPETYYHHYSYYIKLENAQTIKCVRLHSDATNNTIVENIDLSSYSGIGERTIKPMSEERIKWFDKCIEVEEVLSFPMKESKIKLGNIYWNESVSTWCMPLKSDGTSDYGGPFIQSDYKGGFEYITWTGDYCNCFSLDADNELINESHEDYKWIKYCFDNETYVCKEKFKGSVPKKGKKEFPEKFAVNVNNSEEWQAALSLFQDLGVNWCNGKKPKELGDFNKMPCARRGNDNIIFEGTISHNDSSFQGIEYSCEEFLKTYGSGQASEPIVSDPKETRVFQSKPLDIDQLLAKLEAADREIIDMGIEAADLAANEKAIIEQKDRKIKNLEGCVENHFAEIESLNIDCNNWEQHYKDLEKGFNSLDSDLADALRKVADKEHELEVCRSNWQASQDHAQKLKEQLFTVKIESENMESYNVNQRNVLRGAISELKDSRSKLEVFRDDLIGQLHASQIELESLQNKLGQPKFTKIKQLFIGKIS